MAESKSKRKPKINIGILKRLGVFFLIIFAVFIGIVLFDVLRGPTDGTTVDTGVEIFYYIGWVVVLVLISYATRYILKGRK